MPSKANSISHMNCIPLKNMAEKQGDVPMQLKYKYSQAYVKVSPKGRTKIGCLRKVTP